MISADAQNMGPAIARKVGEGFERPDADIDLPLDIVYNKLIDWLVPHHPSHGCRHICMKSRRIPVEIP